MRESSMKKMFISPHPDDVEIGCGGTIARATEDGHQAVIVVAIGNGNLHMLHSNEVVPFEQRKKEQRRAAICLGVEEVVYMNLAPAAHLDEIPLCTGISAMDRLLIDMDPHELYVPYPSFAQDHQYVFQMCMAATRPTRKDQLAIFLYEQPSQFHGQQLHGPLYSRYYVKLQDRHMEAKMQAIESHESQMNGRTLSLVGTHGPHTLLCLRGAEIGTDYAEMFHVLRMVV